MRKIRQAAYGRMTTHMVQGLRFKHMAIGFNVEEHGLAPRDVVKLTATAFVRHMQRIAMLMVYASRSLAPSSHGGEIYAGSLADSIIYTTKPDAKGIMAYTIGVDADRWKSDYDAKYLEMYGKKPWWGTLSNNKNLILYNLHEYWSLISHRIEKQNKYRTTHDGMNKMGNKSPLERAKDKKGKNPYPQVDKYISGIPVGEKFLFNGIYSVWQKESRFTGKNTQLRYSSLFPDLSFSGRNRATGQISGSRIYKTTSGAYTETHYDTAAKGLRQKEISEFALPPKFTRDALINTYGAVIPKSWYTQVPLGWSAKNKVVKVPTSFDRYVFRNLNKRKYGQGGDYLDLHSGLRNDNERQDAEGNTVFDNYSDNNQGMNDILDNADLAFTDRDR